MTIVFSVFPSKLVNSIFIKKITIRIKSDEIDHLFYPRNKVNFIDLKLPVDIC